MGMLLLTSADRIASIDLTDLTYLASITGYTDLRGVQVSGLYAYYVDNSTDTFYIADISDPSEISQVSY